MSEQEKPKNEPSSVPAPLSTVGGRSGAFDKPALRPANLARWAMYDTWTLDEATMLCCGLDPTEYPQSKWEDLPSKIKQKCKDIYHLAFRSAMSGGGITQQPKPVDFVQWAVRKHVDIPELQAEVGKYWGPVATLEQQCKKLQTENTELQAKLEQRMQPSGWPWGAHDTERLRALAAAAEKYWKLYDPGDETTAPKNSDVVEFLVTQPGISKTMAETMATILRADGLRTGPR